MAEALCGPSNPLQAFRKQTSLDRSLQQDRLRAGSQPQESFRSLDRNAYSLNTEFEAFAGPSQQPSLPTFASGLGAFQQFSYSQTAPSPQSQSTWIKEFSQLHLPRLEVDHAIALDPKTAPESLQRSAIAPNATKLEQTMSPNNTLRAFTGFYSSQNPLWNNSAAPWQTQAQPQVATAAYDDSKFESAFDRAHEAWVAQEASQSKALGKEEIDQRESAKYDLQPELSLLRHSLWTCMLLPVEQNVHKAALFLSLFEQYDLTSISAPQLNLFNEVLKIVRDNQDNIAAFARYDLSARAAKLSDACHERLLYMRYNSLYPYYELRRDIGIPYNKLENLYVQTAEEQESPVHLVDTKTVATDAELQADLVMQLEQINGLKLADRVLHAVAEPLIYKDSCASNIQFALQMEEELLSTQTAIEDQTLGSRMVAYDKTKSALDKMLSSVSVRTGQSDLPSDAQLTERFHNAHLSQARVSTPSSAEQRPHQHDDELAQTAGELLDKVANNKSSKFQNSSFMHLMRQLNNHEVHVEGDRIVPVDASAKTQITPPTTQIRSSDSTITGEAGLSYTPPSAISSSLSSNTNAISTTYAAVAPPDGQDVVDLLDRPGSATVDDQNDMTTSNSNDDPGSYDSEHAEIGYHGLFEERDMFPA